MLENLKVYRSYTYEERWQEGKKIKKGGVPCKLALRNGHELLILADSGKEQEYMELEVLDVLKAIAGQECEEEGEELE